MINAFNNILCFFQAIIVTNGIQLIIKVVLCKF